MNQTQKIMQKIYCNTNTFPSKILLFGEYIVLYGANALLIPYRKYHGKLAFAHPLSKVQKESNIILHDFSSFLKRKAVYGLNFTILEKDLSQGLFFDSNIPQGFGLGSSGALCAALYKKYSIKNYSFAHPLMFKNFFSSLESYFHHHIASGLDAMACFFQKDFLYSRGNFFFIRHCLKKRINIFLLNTKKQAKTKEVKNIFENKILKKYIHNNWINIFVKMNNMCIKNILNYSIHDFWPALFALSQFMLQHFQALIPSQFHDIWAYGLSTKAYGLKLCGSGGGGYLLGFTKNRFLVEQLLKHYEIEFIR